MESAVMKRIAVLILNIMVCPYSLAPGHMGILKLPSVTWHHSLSALRGSHQAALFGTEVSLTQLRSWRSVRDLDWTVLVIAFALLFAH